MQGHTIDVVITEEGEVKATVQGVKGPACSEISRFLDQLGEVIEDKKTPEYYQQSAQGIGVQVGT